jgi:hypothetical protein
MNRLPFYCNYRLSGQFDNIFLSKFQGFGPIEGNTRTDYEVLASFLYVPGIVHVTQLSYSERLVAIIPYIPLFLAAGLLFCVFPEGEFCV